uniref:SWIM-type domain-containing protein n=1 Tax=Panagrolaimus superbus TaxID=310955 RepID=A0A914YM44_9BILA
MKCEQKDYGVFVTEIQAKSDAEKSNLKAGDCIIQIDGINTNKVEQMGAILKENIKENGFVMLVIERAEASHIGKGALETVNLNNSNEIITEDIQAEDTIASPLAKKSRGKAATYVELEVVESLDEVNLKAKEAGLKYKQVLNLIYYFNCKTSGCGYKWKATITNEILYQIHHTDDGHSHEEVERKDGITKEVKKIIVERLVGNESSNPEAILQACRNKGIRELPTSQQIKNHVSYKKKHLLPHGGNLNFEDIQNLVKDILDDEPDIMDLKYIINEDEPSKTDFAIIFTCKSLLEKQRQQKHAMVDGTFKLIYKGFVVLVFGYSDKNRHVHVTGVAIVSSETTNVFRWLFEFFKSNKYSEGEWMPLEIMADNSRAISAAVAIVFPDATRRNCYSHVIMACKKKWRTLKFTKSESDDIKARIRQLALHSFEEDFDLAATALIDEWRSSQDERYIVFADYFYDQYVRLDKKWFAANGGGCRTDNAIEGVNKWIKAIFISRCVPFMQAVRMIKLYLQKARDTNFGNEEITVTNAEWVAAFEFKRGTLILRDHVRNCYYVRRSQSSLGNTEFLDFLNSRDLIEWTAEDVQNFQENVAVVAPSILFDNEFTCNCSVGARRKLCKHILVIEVITKKRTFPPMAPLRQSLTECGRNKTGRPKKHGPALSRN